MAHQTPRRTGAVHAVRALPERLLIALGVTGVVALLGGALAVAAWTMSPEQMAFVLAGVATTDVLLHRAGSAKPGI